MLHLSTDQILNFNTLPTKCTEMNGDLPDATEFTLCFVPLMDNSSLGQACHGSGYDSYTSRYLAPSCPAPLLPPVSASRMSPDQMMRGSPQSDRALHDSPAVSPQPDPGSQCLGSPAFSDISTDSVCVPSTSSGLSDAVPSLDSVHSIHQPYTPPSSSEDSDEQDQDCLMLSLETFGAIPPEASDMQMDTTSPSPASTSDEEEEVDDVQFYRDLELTTDEGVIAHVERILSQFSRGIFPDIAPKTDESNASATPYTDVVENKKKAKDGKVKRPMNSFFTFSRVYRRKIIEARPNGVHNNIISSHLGLVWRSDLFEQDFKDFFKDGAQHMKLLHSKEFPEYRYRPRKKEKKAEEKAPSRTSSGRVSKPRARARKGGKGAARGPLTPQALSDSDLTNIPSTSTSAPLSPHTFAPVLSPITPTPTRPVTPGDEVTGRGSPVHSPITISLNPGNPGSPAVTSPGSLILSVNPSGAGTRLTPYGLPSGHLGLPGQVNSFLADTMSVICSDMAGPATSTMSSSLASPLGPSTVTASPIDFLDCELKPVVEDSVQLYDLTEDLKFSKEDVYQFNEYCDRIELCADIQ